MNEFQLKQCLRDFEKRFGTQALTPIEIDFLRGKINFTGYLNRCFEEYLQSFYFNEGQSLAPAKHGEFFDSWYHG